jgi:hypothetical protein
MAALSGDMRVELDRTAWWTAFGTSLPERVVTFVAVAFGLDAERVRPALEAA